MAYKVTNGSFSSSDCSPSHKLFNTSSIMHGILAELPVYDMILCRRLNHAFDEVFKSSPTLKARTAANRVFNIAELLHAILSELPMRDLLLSQRVNHLCKDVIARSQKLQAKLFFRQSHDVHDLHEDVPQHVNLLALARIYRSGFLKEDPEMDSISGSDIYLWQRKAGLLPALPEEPRYALVLHPTTLIWPSGGSWIQMLPVQTAHSSYHVHIHDTGESFVVESNVTFEDIMNETKSRIDGNDRLQQYLAYFRDWQRSWKARRNRIANTRKEDKMPAGHRDEQQEKKEEAPYKKRKHDDFERT